MGFAFGPVESKEVYEQIFTGFKEHNVPLDGSVFEADQHKALIAVFADHYNKHLVCLHHFLKSLKDKHFAVFVAHLVRARIEEEFNRLRHRFAGSVLIIIRRHNHSDEIMAALNKEFAKAGLVFDGNEIAVGRTKEQQMRWESVSMWKRVEFRMSGTSGALESTPGHLKDDVKRTQTFNGGVHQLQRQAADSFHSFGARVRHNYSAALRKSQNIARSMEQEMERQSQFFGSSADFCPCGQMVHLTAMFSGSNENSFPVPCCHQFHRGATRPRMTTLPTLETFIPEGAPVTRTPSDGTTNPRCIIRPRRTAR
jgi:hypothetical protein